MTVYVSPIVVYMISGYAKRYGNKWCHLMTDGEPKELHRFAKSIGLNRNWAQREGTRYLHYDLVPSKRKLAVNNGAIEVSEREIVIKCIIDKGGKNGK